MLITSAMPDPAGNAVQQRGWAWLIAARERSHVHLIVLTSQPIHLEQWRAVRALSHRQMIRSAGRRHHRAVRQWLAAYPPDNIIALGKTTWPTAAALDTNLPIYDIAGRLGQDQNPAQHPAPRPIKNWLRFTQRPPLPPGILLVTQAPLVRHLPPNHPREIQIVPPGAEPKFLATLNPPPLTVAPRPLTVRSAA